MPVNPVQCVTYGQSTTIADSNGNILDNQFSPDERNVRVRFHFTALGDCFC
jgi:hypothetical protein